MKTFPRRKFYFLASIATFSISVNINKELVATADRRRLQTNGDVSQADAAVDDARVASRSVVVQVQGSNASHITDLVGEDDVFADQLAGQASAIVSLSGSVPIKEKLIQDTNLNLRVHQHRISSNGSDDQIISSDHNSG